MAVTDFSGIFAHKSLKDVRDLYGEKYSAAMRLLEKGKSENRNLTPSELQTYKDLNAEIDQLQIEVDEATKIDERKKAEAGVYMRSQRSDSTEPKSEFRYADGRSVDVFDRNRKPKKTAGAFNDLGQYLRAIIKPENLTDEQQRSLSSGAGSGSYTVPVNLQQDIISMLQGELALAKAGARTLSLEPGVTKIVKVTGLPTAAWHNQNADIDLSDPTLVPITLDPKSIVALTKISRELLADGLNIGEAITSSMTQAIRKAIEDAAFYGVDGTSYNPVGIDATSGILKYWLDTNGAALSSWAPLNAVDYQLRSRGVSPSAIIASPGAYNAIMGLVDSTSGQPLQPPRNLADMPIYTSPSISEALTRGTSTTSTTSLYYGSWADFIIAIRQDLSIEILKELYRGSDSIGFLSTMRVDFALAHPESFARLSGILPSLTTLQTS